MMDEAIRRADEALTGVVELSRSGKTSCAELRRGLEASKALSAKLDVYQANSASVLAVRESHGDGGAGVLAQAAGLPRRAAAAQVKTAERLQSMPDVQQAVETGRCRSRMRRRWPMPPTRPAPMRSRTTPSCWSCHQKVHRHGWRAVRDGRGLYTIEPPDRVHYGPAHAPDLLPVHAPDALPVPSHERPGTANMDDTARSEPPEAHAGPSGPAAARKAMACARPAGLRPSRRSPRESRPRTLGRRILPRLDPGGGS